MEDRKRQSYKQDEKQESSESDDESLNFSSSQFDPLKALYSSNVRTPVPNARPYCNMSKYYSCAVRGLPENRRTMSSTARGLSGDAQTGGAAAPGSSDQNNPSAAGYARAGPSNPNLEQPVRRFLPHQEPIRTTREWKIRNVMTRMNEYTGPLSLLKKFMDDRIRVKVWTRHEHGIRGYCLAFVAAFDKHFNLALEDVTEVWTRKRRRKIPALDGALPLPPNRRVELPRIVVLKVTPKTETCERHIAQLMMRGEHVVMVARDIPAASSSSKSTSSEMSKIKSSKFKPSKTQSV